MILVLDNEVDPSCRCLTPAITDYLDEYEYRVYPGRDGTLSLEQYDGLILGGSTASVYDESNDWTASQTTVVRRCLARSIPTLGICYGHQLINYALGGEVVEDQRREQFVKMSEYETSDPLLNDVSAVVPVIHSDIVVSPGDGMRSIAATAYNEYFCTRHSDAPIWTVQFHPEFTSDLRWQDPIQTCFPHWSPGPHSFAECTAATVLPAFERYCQDF
ncbi:type 1 glutamine amidotransferase [Natronolimnobius sp. AArcel1]|uniref:type 1 glutamine amidotransferase n=1 Tax=Natronolimnobius sp. AArcel1 TaxID=1679093 RepID=UPI0013ECF58A|nr:type 1 glutamine amidotransferase [Natronolimnobius sp. AArcel1]NGM70527.1 type 1 glutamine amidotransferase [Natronolimnobius sp. AArcel1]